MRILIANDGGIHRPRIPAPARIATRGGMRVIRPRGIRWTRRAVGRYDGRMVLDTGAVARRPHGSTAVPPDAPGLNAHAAPASAPARVASPAG